MHLILTFWMILCIYANTLRNCTAVTLYCYHEYSHGKSTEYVTFCKIAEVTYFVNFLQLSRFKLYFGRLHMLNEIEETMRVFLHFWGDGSTSDDSREGSRVTPQQLLSHWQTRLNMMQVRTPYFTHRSAVIER